MEMYQYNKEIYQNVPTYRKHVNIQKRHGKNDDDYYSSESSKVQ